MTSTSLLLVPLPVSIASRQNDKALAAIFQGQGSEQLKLSAATKNPKLADEDAFYKYLIVLKALGNMPLYTEWTNPFKSNEVIKSQNAYAETANTIWNFIVFLQNRILSYDASSTEEGKKIKNCIADIHALIQDLQFIVDNFQHPVYTSNLVECLKAYTKYTDALLLLQAAMNSQPKKPGQMVKASQACYNCLYELESTLNHLDKLSKSYFSQFVPLMEKYYIGLSYLEAGKDQNDIREYGIAIAYFRAGIDKMKGIETIHCPYVQVTSVAKMVCNALTVIEKQLTNDNHHIYSKYVPEEPPVLPTGFPIKPDMIPPTQALLIFENTDDLSPGFGGDYPSVPNSQTLNMSAVDIPTGFPGSTNPNVPVFTPQNGTQSHVPVFTPPGSYGQPPMTQQFGGPPQYGAPQGVSQAEQLFPTWKMLNDLKAKTVQRMQTLRSTKPGAAQIIEQYIQQSQIAAQSDVTIQTTIQTFIQNGPQAGITKETIESMIGQAVNFYHSLDDRLDQIEQRY